MEGEWGRGEFCRVRLGPMAVDVAEMWGGAGWLLWAYKSPEASARTCEHLTGRAGDQLATGGRGTSPVTEMFLFWALGSECSRKVHSLPQPFPSVGL